MTNILSNVKSGVGFITLARPQSLNALSLEMVLELSRLLNSWKSDPSVEAVAIRGSNREGPFGHFCAGGDIRFFHEAGLAGDPKLDEFFSEEYRLNHLIFTFPKPYIAFMDGIVMGGGMGISQGASLRIVTEDTKMAMPETGIGFFPDVGGGFFLSRCDGYLGEYLALTGQMLLGDDAINAGLADYIASSHLLESHWDNLGNATIGDASQRVLHLKSQLKNKTSEIHQADWWDKRIDEVFAMNTVQHIIDGLAALGEGWPAKVLSGLLKRSPLMLEVTLQQIRRGRHMKLADELRMERDMVRHCFQTRHLGRSGKTSETVEGIRALAVDKDRNPCWEPSRIEEVTSDMVEPFFDSPWSPDEHPLSDLV